MDFELAPANAPDLAVGTELLEQHTHRTVLADKAYISAEVAAQLLRQNGIRLLALRRDNQKEPLPAALTQLISRTRQIIETVNGQLEEQFCIARNYAHSF